MCVHMGAYVFFTCTPRGGSGRTGKGGGHDRGGPEVMRRGVQEKAGSCGWVNCYGADGTCGRVSVFLLKIVTRKQGHVCAAKSHM